MLASTLQINDLSFSSWIVAIFKLNVSPHKSSAFLVQIFFFFLSLSLRNSIDLSVLRVANIDVPVFKAKDLFIATK